MTASNSHTGRESTEDEPTAGLTSRRGWLKLLGAGTALLGAGAGSGAADAAEQAQTRVVPDELAHRLNDELRVRTHNARYQLKEAANTTPHEANDRVDPNHVIDKFGKGLAHEEETGLPTTTAYESLRLACGVGSGYDRIRQADISPAEDNVVPSDDIESVEPRPLVQPESAWSYCSQGASPAGLRIATPPAFDSPDAGAEMVELYWRALTRDVNFRDYGESALIRIAATELNGLDAYAGPGADGRVTAANVFRGVTPGATTGPHVSQFLWKDRSLGGGVEDQKIQPQVAETTPKNYLTTVEDWLKVQKGVAPAADQRLPGSWPNTD